MEHWVMAGSVAAQGTAVAEPPLARGDFLLGHGAANLPDHLLHFFGADDAVPPPWGAGDSQVVILADFQPGRDLLELTYQARFHAETGLEIPPILTITRQGKSSAIALDGLPVALVQNVGDLQPDDVILLADHAASSLI